MTNQSSNPELIRVALQAADAGDLERCRSYLHPELVVTIAGVPEPIAGLDPWLDGVAAMAQAFPDLETKVQDVVGSGDLVAVRSLITGTHRGTFHGVEATGRPIKVMSNDFYRIEAGQVVEAWIVTDTGTLFAQIT